MSPVSGLEVTVAAWSPLRCRILAVEVVDESPSDIQGVGSVNQRHLAAIDDHVDVVGLGINLQRFADVILKRREYLLATSVVSSLSVFSLTLKILLHLIQLVLFRLQRFGISNGCGLLDFVGKRLDFCCIVCSSVWRGWNSRFKLVIKVVNRAMPVLASRNASE